MHGDSKLIEDYSVTTVPESQTTSGWRVALIVIGINVGLATFLNGAQVGSALGLNMAVLCALLSSTILCVMGSLTSIVSVRSRLTTYMLVQHSFGVKGAAIVNVMLAVIHLGWFGVNASFFGSAMVTAIQELYNSAGPFELIVMGGSVLMALTTIFGFKAINRVALVTTVVLLAIFIAVFVMSIRKYGIVLVDETPAVPMTFGIALSALIGGNLLTVVAMPDIARFITTNRQAVLGMILCFPLAYPLLFLLAAVPTMATDQVDIMPIITGFGFGVPALMVLVFSTWTANSLNLYSYSLGLSATVKSVRPWKFTVVGAVVGGALAVGGIVDSFVPFLLLLGVIIPPIAAIFVIDNFTIFRKGYSREALEAGPSFRWPAMVTWVVSAGVSILVLNDVFTLTTAPALDATLVATVMYLAVRKFGNR
jgi:cytosine permease